MASNILFEVTVLNGSTPKTIWMAGAAASKDGVQINGHEWLPLIIKKTATSGSWSDNGVFQQGSINYSGLSFRMSEAYGNNVWSSYEWTGGLARIFIQTGDNENDFASYEQVFEGSVSSLDRQGTEATVALLGPDALLDRDLLTLEYAGTGSAEGPASLKGKLKPYAFGNCQNVEPVLIDPARWIYQVHGYGAVQGITPYEYAQALDPAKNKGDASDYPTLANLSLAPGEWATCAAQGMFRFGGAPSKKVTADVSVGGMSAGTIISSLLTQAGIPGAKIAIGLLPQNWSFYAKDQVSIGEVARLAAFHTGNVLFADGTGTWQTMDFNAPQTPIPLSVDRGSKPKVKSYRELNAAAPVWKVRVGHSKCWSVHSSSDVSPSLAVNSDDVQAALTAAQNAKDAAAVAQSDATAAKQRLDAIESDGVLDRSEKADIVQRFGSYTAERTALLAQGTTYGLSTERANYDNAYSQLKTYLEGLLPSYTDSTQNTPIDRATFSNRFTSYLTARQALLNAVANKTATLSSWSGVSGPGKPADNATVGAPIGTNVGDVPAGTVVDAIKDSTGTVKPARDQIAAVKATIDATVTQTRNDLQAEVDRAKGAEGTINQTLTNVKSTADQTATGLQDQVTLTNNLANRATSLEAAATSSSSGAALNPNFGRWPSTDATPTSWNSWEMKGSARFARVNGGGVRGSPFAVDARNDTPNVNWGLVQTVAMYPGKWVIECSMILDQGGTRGAGVTLSGVAGMGIDFIIEPDLNGNTGNVQGVRSWSKTVDWTMTGMVNLHAMCGWDGFGATIDAKYMRWFYLNVRPVTDGELKGIRADTNATSALAKISTEETARINGDNAAAQKISTVEASFSKAGYLNRNASFNETWDTNGIPPGWQPWARDGNGYIGWYDGMSGLYGSRALLIDRPGQNCGVKQELYGNFPKGWYALDMEGRFENGDTRGSGMLAQFKRADGVEHSNGNIAFWLDKDTSGFVGSRTNRKFTKLIWCNEDSSQISFYLMAGWDGFAAPSPGYLKTVWYRAGIRPATQSEIDGKTVIDANVVARVGSLETTTSNLTTSTASRLSFLEAGYSTDSGSIVVNPTFKNWPDSTALPASWSWWDSTAPAIRAGGVNGRPYALQFNAPANANSGLVQGGISAAFGSYIIEFSGRATDWQGAGVLVYFLDANGGIVEARAISAAAIADTSGYVNRDGGGGAYTRTFPAFHKTAINGAIRQIQVYAMANWDGFGERAAKTITFDKVSIRPATAAEINGQKIEESNVLARVSTSEGAISNLQGRTSAYWQVQAVAGNNRAQIGLYADQNGGAGVDIVSDVTIRGSNGNGQTIISNGGISIYYPNGQIAVRLGI
ncbi:hypothetical protein [Sphingomonas sp. R1]|uniref:hypothetical protein n=1 Tax=Sphingomonas sp. R1 TaxID=399176 RepID=UPI00222487DF|nr:hypothetical protein [Sphingomonas sp. R1]UYY77489.1 hypothetical protein OIM94_00300 [Sphingomonas sp. R1]